MRSAPAACDLLVVSHAAVLASNQEPYVELARRGVRVELVVPATWRHGYSAAAFGAEIHPDLVGSVHTVAVVGAGRPQRHVHATSLRRFLDPRIVRCLLIEEEPFSASAVRWSLAARRRGVPYGVQVAETKQRSLPAPAAQACRRVLAGASFVVARSPAAADLARRWGARREITVVPHSVSMVGARSVPSGPFTLAYVGRLVEEKGVQDLLAAVQLLDGGVELVVAGDGPLASEVAAAGAHVRWLGGLSHDRVADVYARAHVTCVPSRTTPTWEEQFGRVIVESLAAAVPVIATATGEIPWVLAKTGGGRLVPQRAPEALAAAISLDAADRDALVARGAAGRAGVEAAFSHPVVATELEALVRRVSSARRPP